MKLLDKKTIDQGKVVQQRQEVERGIELARKVDDLRAKRLLEEENVKKWRDETLRIVKGEIKDAVTKRDEALEEAKAAEKRRFEAEAPLDVQNERVRNEKQFKVNEKTAEELIAREAHIIEKESSIEVKKRDFIKRESSISKVETDVLTLLEAKKLAYEEANTLKSETKALKDAAQFELDRKYDELYTRQNELALFDKNLTNKEDAVERQRRENEHESIHIRSQQSSLRAAWESIRKLKADI